MFEDSVTIVLDKERHLKLTIGGMKKFREATGIDLLKGGNLDNCTEDHITAFFWSCLLHEDRKLTLEDVGYMLNPGNLAVITDAMMKVWKLAMPESEGVPAPNLPSRPPG
jgi:hypothetical protein